VNELEWRRRAASRYCQTDRHQRCRGERVTLVYGVQRWIRCECVCHLSRDSRDALVERVGCESVSGGVTGSVGLLLVCVGAVLGGAASGVARALQTDSADSARVEAVDVLESVQVAVLLAVGGLTIAAAGHGESSKTGGAYRNMESKNGARVVRVSRSRSRNLIAASGLGWGCPSSPATRRARAARGLMGGSARWGQWAMAGAWTCGVCRHRDMPGCGDQGLPDTVWTRWLTPRYGGQNGDKGKAPEAWWTTRAVSLLG
jgi:hypothetical protein